MKLEDFGIKDGINEVVGTTRWKRVNSAPIGIRKDGKDIRALLYPGSHTFENVKNSEMLVANIVHDPVVFAISSFDDLDHDHYLSFDPPVLRDASSYVVFRAELEGNTAYLRFEKGEILKREIRAINRGLNAIIEACVHGTRFKGEEETKERIEYYLHIAEKCGGERERMAVNIIKKYLGF